MATEKKKKSVKINVPVAEVKVAVLVPGGDKKQEQVKREK